MFTKLIADLQEGGIFVGQFFGVRDSWNLPQKNMTFFTKEEAEAQLSSLKILQLSEEEKDGLTAKGTTKHWHVFHIIAQKIDH
jgi:tellurite methyltransferase